VTAAPPAYSPAQGSASRRSHARFPVSPRVRKRGSAFWRLRLAEPNFYLLDEPTNHVDIPGQEQLEAELLAQGATCVLVSHDRSFVDAVGTRFLLIAQGQAREACDTRSSNGPGSLLLPRIHGRISRLGRWRSGGFGGRSANSCRRFGLPPLTGLLDRVVAEAREGV